MAATDAAGRAPLHHRAMPVIHYDAVRRRLWIYGQRCHHGATGALLSVAALPALLFAAVAPPLAVVVLLGGAVLMAHDWKDRSIWFEPGWQSQP